MSHFLLVLHLIYIKICGYDMVRWENFAVKSNYKGSCLLLLYLTTILIQWIWLGTTFYHFIITSPPPCVTPIYKMSLTGICSDCAVDDSFCELAKLDLVCSILPASV